MSRYLDYDPDDIDVRFAEMVTATHDSADTLAHPKVREALALLRTHLGMDVAFVSQFVNGRRVYKVVDSTQPIARVQVGLSDPLEQSWCQWVVEGRLPGFMANASEDPRTQERPLEDPVGSFLSVPIRLADGGTYGTLCCYSATEVEGVQQRDLGRLHAAARVLSEELRQDGLGEELQLQPREDDGWTRPMDLPPR